MLIISGYPLKQTIDLNLLNSDFFSFWFLRNHFNISFCRDAILSITGLTVFKQEAPSPTSHDPGPLQIVRQTHQSPTSTQGHLNTTNAALEDGNSGQNMLHQLLGHSGYSTLQNAIEGWFTTYYL